jgi:hypothetical protein
MRTNEDFRADATHIQETAHKEAADKTGIAGLAILAQLPSIDFPRSFPPDSMHLFFENVVPALVRHYRGIFFKGATSEHDNSQVVPEQLVPSGSRKRKRPAVNSRTSATSGVTRGTAARQAAGSATTMKFKRTSDCWNVEPKVWERIGRDQKVNKCTSSLSHAWKLLVNTPHIFLTFAHHIR